MASDEASLFDGLCVMLWLFVCVSFMMRYVEAW